MLCALSDDLEVDRDTKQLGSGYAEGMQCRKLAPTQQGCDEGAVSMLAHLYSSSHSLHYTPLGTMDICTYVHTCHKQDFGK